MTCMIIRIVCILIVVVLHNVALDLRLNHCIWALIRANDCLWVENLAVVALTSVCSCHKWCCLEPETWLILDFERSWAQPAITAIILFARLCRPNAHVCKLMHHRYCVTIGIKTSCCPWMLRIISMKTTLCHRASGRSTDYRLRFT